MEALLVVDAQNEFSLEGLRPVPNHAKALETNNVDSEPELDDLLDGDRDRPRRVVLAKELVRFPRRSS